MNSKQDQLLPIHQKESLDELEQSAIDIGEEFIIGKELNLLEVDNVDLLQVVEFEENINYKHYNSNLGCIKGWLL